MELQHINVKLILDRFEQTDLEPLIPIFHRWIQDKVCPELLLDIADYSHVHEGPGVVLIGFEANYSVDNTDGRMGVRYNRKTLVDGANQDRLAQAARAAIEACRHLEADPLLAGKLRFDGRHIEISINDRLLAPNNETTRQAVDSDFQLFSRKLFQKKAATLSYVLDPRNLLAVSLQASTPVTLPDLLANLDS